MHKHVLLYHDERNEVHKNMEWDGISADYYKDDINREQRDYHLIKSKECFAGL